MSCCVPGRSELNRLSGAGPCPGIPFACSLDPGEPQAEGEPRALQGPRPVGGRTGGDWGGGGSRAGPTVMPDRWWSAAGGGGGRQGGLSPAHVLAGAGAPERISHPLPRAGVERLRVLTGHCGVPCFPVGRQGCPVAAQPPPVVVPVPQGWQSPVPAGAGGARCAALLRGAGGRKYLSRPPASY